MRKDREPRPYKKRARKVNRTEINGDVTRIYFSNTDNYALIDTVDYPLVKDFCWHETVQGYVGTRGIGRKDVPLHRFCYNLKLGWM